MAPAQGMRDLPQLRQSSSEANRPASLSRFRRSSLPCFAMEGRLNDFPRKGISLAKVDVGKGARRGWAKAFFVLILSPPSRSLQHAYGALMLEDPS